MTIDFHYLIQLGIITNGVLQLKGLPIIALTLLKVAIKVGIFDVGNSDVCHY